MGRIEGIRGIVSFVRTANAGSFSAAAKQLGITPVAVSKNVQRLERQMGVRLLQRSTRQLALTQEGRLFYERCAAPLRELEAVQGAVREKGAAPAGTVRVTAVSPFARSYVLPLLPAFNRAYPGIEVDLVIDDEVSDMIAGGFDVGIRVGEMRDESIIARKIAPLHFVVCGAPAYIAQNGVPATPKELAQHNCLRLKRGSRPERGMNWRLGAKSTPVDPPVRGNFSANDLTTLVTAAVHGHGLVLAPLPLVLPLFRSGALVPVLPDYITQPAYVFLHYPNRKLLPARVRAFVSFMLDALRRHQDLVTDPRSRVDPFVARP